MSNGYGALWHNESVRTAHRVAWELWNGKVPPGMHVCHTCDNRKCVNPSHLFVGTNLDNRIDSVRKKRHKWPILRGIESPNAKLSTDDVLFIRQSSGTSRLAKEFGVSKTTINKVKRRISYTNVI